MCEWYSALWLEKDAPHSTAASRTLPLVQQVEFVDELHEVVAALVDRSHQRHECHVVALRVELCP